MKILVLYIWGSYRLFKNLKFQKKIFKKSISKDFSQAVELSQRLMSMICINLRLKIYKKNCFQNLKLILKVSPRPLLYFEKNEKLT